MLKTLLLTGILFVAFGFVRAQEVSFFTNGTDDTFYDQGIVNTGSMGDSYFEVTHPPGLPQYNDKVPCSTTAYKESTSLKFNYTSSPDGNWRATIYRSDWSTADISGMDSLSFFVYSEDGVPASVLPLIGLKANKLSGSGDVSSELYALEQFNDSVPAGEWTQITFPLDTFLLDDANSDLNFSETKGVIFNQSEQNNISRLILIDEITAFRSLEEIPVVKNLSVAGYDSHAELQWEQEIPDLAYRIYASFDAGENYEIRAETTDKYFLDFVPATARNSSVLYRVAAISQGNESEPVEATAQIHDFSDEELLDMVQRYTFRYFWEGAHQATGMALERSNGNGRTAASGATGMGLMAMIVAHEREYKPQVEIENRILKVLEFLTNCDRHHGAWSHWYNADTYETQPFSEKDDGGDIVETSYVAQGLIALKNYLSGNDTKSTLIRERADELWREIEWSWYQNNENVLYWHWSPNYDFEMNMKVQGWNEALVTYIMAASSPTYPISKEVYANGWARNGGMVSERSFYGFDISLSPDWGGPLFWIHYSQLGINPHGLKDQYADYWQEYVNTAKIHHAYAIDNPMDHESYSDSCWGLTASDDPDGYTAHQPVHNDNGTISPTAALASMPYTPEESMKALKYFYRERGAGLFGKYGFYDAFNDNFNWVAESYLGIDQGPIVVMIENFRTGLLWNSVMKDADVQAGLDKLGFEYEIPTGAKIIPDNAKFEVYPNPAENYFYVSLNTSFLKRKITVTITGLDGKQILTKEIVSPPSEIKIDCSGIDFGFYIVELTDGNTIFNTKLLIQN
jgi:hypothetical protein